MRAVLISLEPWDQVWRRNQHLGVELVRQGLISRLWFVEPVVRAGDPMTTRAVHPGIIAVRPASRLPKTLGGLVRVGRQLERRIVKDVDLLWVNDPTLGVHCISPRTSTIYDVTDDWRTAGFPTRIVKRIIRAEDRLAQQASTVVCSTVLRQRWQDRYGVAAQIVHNGIDSNAWLTAAPLTLEGAGGHVGYIGTLHEQRLDIDLIVQLARHPQVGTVHLVGPNCLSEAASRRLHNIAQVRIHGPVSPAEVPSWMKAMDVLVSPHLVNDFTLSLDAIKSYEYAASGRPIVATPTSGFQVMEHPELLVADASGFPAAVTDSLARTKSPVSTSFSMSWAARAKEFFAVATHSDQIVASEQDRAVRR